jgi:hypothetical protein
VSGGITQGQLANCYLCATINGIERVSPGYLEGRLFGGPDIVASQQADGRVVFMEQPPVDLRGYSPVFSQGSNAELATEKAWALARGNPAEVVIDPALRASPDPYMSMARMFGATDPNARASYGNDPGGFATEPMRQFGLVNSDYRLPAFDSTVLSAAQRPGTVGVLSSVGEPGADTVGNHSYTIGGQHGERFQVLNPHGEGDLSLTPSEVPRRFGTAELAQIPEGGPRAPELTTEHLETLARNLPWDHPGAQMIRQAIDPVPTEGVTRGPTVEPEPGGYGRAAGAALFAGVPIASNALVAANESYKRDTGEGFLNPTIESGLKTINEGSHIAGQFFPVSSMVAAPVRDYVSNLFGDTFKDPSLTPGQRAAGEFVQDGVADTAGLIAALPVATTDLALLPFTAPIRAAQLLGTAEPLTAATQNAAFRRDMDLASSTYRDMVAASAPADAADQRAYQAAALEYARDPFVQQQLYDAERFLGVSRGTGTMQDVDLANRLVAHYESGVNDSADAEIAAAQYAVPAEPTVPTAPTTDPFAGAQIVDTSNTVSTGEIVTAMNNDTSVDPGPDVVDGPV